MTSNSARVRAIDRRRAKLRAELEAIEAARVELVHSMRVDDGMSYGEIARQLGITKGRAQQLVKQAETVD